ncbi:AAA family ATPase [Candidatus Micrarchaeota archaeon]|nr:AAA family ATPase [Candidatus Micrarchaeota archaeon]
MGCETTKDILIPKNPIDTVIGQERAVNYAKICVKQKRHLLLIGPPGTGKSMIAQSISNLIPKPKEEIVVTHNEKNENKPLIKIKTITEIKKNKKKEKVGTYIDPIYVPYFVSEALGFKCKRCSKLSNAEEWVCPYCGAQKYQLAHDILGLKTTRKDSIDSTRITNGKEERIIFKREGNRILSLTEKEEKKVKEIELKLKEKTLIPLDRNPFVQAIGASETELLGDIQHDPYGNHKKIGTPSYLRVLPGAVHEAHEGVLYLDELSSLGEIQRYLLTAMQDKKFSITSKNPTSSGASIKVENVPCDFILIASANINDLPNILPALRNRIRGQGYEILFDTVMEENEENKKKLFQFIAQEIKKDGKIPDMNLDAAEIIIEKSKELAKKIDNENGYSLRFRILNGIIRMAGDIAVSEDAELIDKTHVKKAIEENKTIEEQLSIKHSNWYSTEMSDFAFKKNQTGREIL